MALEHWKTALPPRLSFEERNSGGQKVHISQDGSLWGLQDSAHSHVHTKDCSFSW